MAEEAIGFMGWAMLGWFIWLIADTGPVYAEDAVTIDYTSANVTWDAPTERENGDPMPSEELLFYELHVNQLPVYEGDIVVYEVSSDRTQYDLQLLANECFTVTMYAAATGSPSCKPEQQYVLSAPSNAVTHCTGEASMGMHPNPPKELGL